jgi:hypothetical protein
MGKRFRPTVLLVLGLVVEGNSQAGGAPGADWMHLASPEQAGWSGKKLVEVRRFG